MSQSEIPCEELRKEIVEELRKREWCYLATSLQDYVRVGLMRMVSKDLKIWCYTDNRSRKYKQIEENPKVALADRNLQIEGTATLKGHPLDLENSEFIESYRNNQPENYERTSKRQFKRSRPEFRVIEIHPTRIALLKMGTKFQENEYLTLDLKKEKVYRFTSNSNFESPVYQKYF